MWATILLHKTLEIRYDFRKNFNFIMDLGSGGSAVVCGVVHSPKLSSRFESPMGKSIEKNAGKGNPVKSY